MCDSGKGKRKANKGDVNDGSKYCQVFSQSPWTKPTDGQVNKDNHNSAKEKLKAQEEEFASQYLAKQQAANNNCEERCIPQPKPKPKFKKRSVKPFATTDQLRDKIFGYIENQANISPLRPFRGYRDEIVRQQLCCTDDIVTHPPDPCPPADECEKWFEILRTCNMEEKEAVLCEVRRMKEKLPCGLSEEEELSMMQCMGASKNAMCAFKDELEAAKNAPETSCTCPPPATVQPCPGADPCPSKNADKPCPQKTKSCPPEKPKPCPSKKSKPCPPQNSNACPPQNSNPCPAKNSNVCPPKKSNTCPPKKSYTCPPKKSNTCPPKKSNTCPPQKSNPCPKPCPPQKAKPCPAPCPPPTANPCSSEMPAKAKKCKSKNTAVKQSNCQTDELESILRYCKQRMAENEDEEMEHVDEDGGEEAFSVVSVDPSPIDDEITHDGDGGGHLNDGEWEPDPLTRCEEAGEDDDEVIEAYKNHIMFGEPDPPPKRTMKEELKMYKEHIANIRRRYFGEMMKTIDDIEGITPDIAAAMVYSEELGMKIKSAPQKAYDYLYPEVPSQPVLNIGYITEAAPKGIDDIVVPLAPPMILTAADFPGLEDPAMLDHPRILQVMPSMNLAEDPKASDTMPPNDICELVTGTTHTNMMTLLFPEYDGMEVDEEDEEDERFNIKLNPSIPPHFSQIQIRGSEPPNWFPGYYVALPSKKEVYIEKKYGVILEKVWEEVQPELVRPGGGATVIGV